MVVFGQSGCIGEEVVVFAKKLLYLGKSGCFRAKWLYSGSSGSIWEKVVVFGKIGFIQAKVVVFGQGGGIWAKVVIFLQNGCIRAKWLFFSVKSGLNRAQLLYLAKSGFIREKVVVFGKNGCIRGIVVAMVLPLITLYNAMILSLFDYCSAVWDGCSKTNRDYLDNLQTRAASIIEGRKVEQCAIHDILDWPTLESRRKYQICLQVFKCVNGLAPAYLLNEFNFSRDFHKYKTRNKDLIRVSRAKTTKYQSSFR